MLDQEIRSCQGCGFRRGAKQPVPSEGPRTASVAFIGEAPGRKEDETGKPFCGDAGKFLDSLLRGVGLERVQVFVTNCLRCKPRNNATPTPAQVKVCASKWLDKELELVKPELIVTLGGPATHYITGLDDTMEHLHGRPIQMDGVTVLPAYHPAAGFHNTSLMRFIFDDFEVLKKLLDGHTADSLVVKDQYPEPKYEVVKSAKMAKELLREPRYALDTEQTADGKLWSLQVSLRAGESYFIPAELVAPTPHHAAPAAPPHSTLSLPESSEVAVHFYLHEAKYLDVPNFLDCMVLAYLLGLPQGLKELAGRLCGMKMVSYPEMVRPYRREKAIRYLEEAQRHQWCNPPKVEIMEWDKKWGKPVIRALKVLHIKNKINARLVKAGKDESYDPYADWFNNVSQAERAEVESVLGVMPDADLSDIDFDKAVQYASRDSDATLRVLDTMLPMIKEQKLGYILRIVDQPILPMVRSMMDRGAVVDTEYLKELSGEYFGKMVEASKEATRIAKEPFNPNSSQQVSKVVYGKLGFKPTKYTDTGLESTLDNELAKVKHPIIEPILDYRKYLKLKATYADSLVELAVPDEQGEMRVHTELMTTRTETKRLASKNPNLQNQPVRDEDGRKIRNAFSAPRGGGLVAPDYSGQEMRYLAHVSGCVRLIKLFREGRDAHTETAMELFGVDEVTAKKREYRDPTKTTNFGVSYGITEDGLYEAFLADGIEGWSPDSCGKFIKDWYILNAGVKEWQQETTAFAVRNGYVVDMFGSRRWIPEVYCPVKKIRAAGERQAINTLIQMPCATITKLGMKAVWNGLDEWDGALIPILQIHDELLLELLKPKLLMDVARWLKARMEAVVELSVPVVVDVKAGERWGEMEELEL